MTAPTIVFDLDGTLVDTAPDLIAALHAVFAHEGLTAPATDLRTLIGGGARPLIDRALREARIEASKSEIERLYLLFLEYYAAHIADRSQPFPRLEPALATLTDAGCRLAVCTNKLEHLAVQLLGQLDLVRWFSAICAQDTFGLSKPNPEMLRRTITQAGGSAERALMVGDSINDIEMARRAALPIVAVDFGYSETPVSQLGPDRTISRYDELPHAVRDLLRVATG
jgi:phosphoglycolate phosphatase